MKACMREKGFEPSNLTDWSLNPAHLTKLCYSLKKNKIKLNYNNKTLFLKLVGNYLQLLPNFPFSLLLSVNLLTSSTSICGQ